MHAPLPTDAIEQLLRLSVKAIRSGNRQGARALLRALVREQPNELRGWLWLAAVAETLTEQQQALERVLALEPTLQVARRGLERVYARVANATATATGLPPQHALSTAETPPAVPETSQSVPSGEATLPSFPAIEAREDQGAAVTAPKRASRAHIAWRALVVGGGVLVILLALFSMTLQRQGGAETDNRATPTLRGRDALSSAPVSEGRERVSQATASVGVTATSVVGGLVERFAPTTPVTPTSTAPPPTPTTASKSVPTPLPLGSIVAHEGWQATLLRPDYAQVLTGAVGEVSPDGQFVLALIAIGNTIDVPRRLPPDLFLLVDNQGRSYTVDVKASSVYLEIHGRGRGGDRAFTDELPSGSGLYSMPLLFDVPRDANGLLLTMGGHTNAGWPLNVGANPEETPVVTVVPNAGP